MPRNSSGSYTLPEGNPVVEGTVVEATWANDTLADLENEVTKSLDRDGRGGMAAALKVVDGTLAAPGVAFGSDLNTGLHRAGPDDLRLVAGGVAAARVTPSGLTHATLVDPEIKATTAATAAEPQDAATLSNGNLALAGASPNASVGFSNRLTPGNLIKAWGRFTTDAFGGVVLLAGFNVSGLAINGSGHVVVTLAAPMADANYGVTTTSVTAGSGGPVAWNVPHGGVLASAFALDARALTTGAPVDAGTDEVGCAFAVLGAQ